MQYVTSRAWFDSGGRHPIVRAPHGWSAARLGAPCFEGAVFSCRRQQRSARDSHSPDRDPRPGRRRLDPVDRADLWCASAQGAAPADPAPGARRPRLVGARGAGLRRQVRQGVRTAGLARDRRHRGGVSGFSRQDVPLVLRSRPPILGSSVPHCPCGNDTPCACERYARRLELSQHVYAARALEAIATLRALAGVVRSATVKRTLLTTAEALL